MNIIWTLLLLLIVSGIIGLGYYLTRLTFITITNADYIEAARRQRVPLSAVEWGHNCSCPLAIASERLVGRPVYATVSAILTKQHGRTLIRLEKPFTWLEFEGGKRQILNGKEYSFTSKIKVYPFI